MRLMFTFFILVELMYSDTSQLLKKTYSLQEQFLSGSSTSKGIMGEREYYKKEIEGYINSLRLPLEVDEWSIEQLHQWVSIKGILLRIEGMLYSMVEKEEDFEKKMRLDRKEFEETIRIFLKNNKKIPPSSILSEIYLHRVENIIGLVDLNIISISIRVYIIEDILKKIYFYNKENKELSFYMAGMYIRYIFYRDILFLRRYFYPYQALNYLKQSLKSESKVIRFLSYIWYSQLDIMENKYQDAQKKLEEAGKLYPKSAYLEYVRNLLNRNEVILQF